MSQLPITAFLRKRSIEEGEPLLEGPTKRAKSTTTTEAPAESKRVAESSPNCKRNQDTPLKESPLIVSPKVDMNVVIKNTKARGAFALSENIGKTWFRALQGEFNKSYFYDLSKFVVRQRESNTVYPPEDQVYSWTRYFDIRSTRVVILGQDPYHQPGQAHGLCFSVQKGIAKPPSLVNIFQELSNDIKGFDAPDHGDLTGWAKQGILLLNACLTVNQGQANSHSGKGWETFTDQVITWISKNVTTSVVFLLWGNYAQKKKSLILARHKILTSVHPSPLSAHRGFFGCKHFSKTNEHLRKQGLSEINWKSLP